jgi:hypothetical protein
MRLCSTRLKSLSASPAGVPPTAVSLSVANGPASGQGHRRVLANVNSNLVQYLLQTDIQKRTEKI